MLLHGPLPWWRDGERFELGDGRVALSTGQLVVCDPLVRLDEARPLARRVPPGAYDVRFGYDAGDSAYAVVRFTDGEPVRWELAATNDVDASSIAYVDAAALPFLRQLGSDQLHDRAYAAGYDKRPYALVALRPGDSLALLGTGGDGRFGSFWGLDAAGEACVLVTDYGTLGRSPEVTPAGPPPPAPIDEPPTGGAKVIPFRPRKR